MNKKPNVQSRLFNFNPFLITLSLAFAIPAQAQQFSNVISFGDSLSDAGNFGSVIGLPGNSFTTNPDPVAAERIAAAFGHTQTYSNQVGGGFNFAWGGACVQTATSATTPPCISNAVPRIPVQISQYLTPRGNVADPTALYTLWAGANDIFAPLGAGLWTNAAAITAGVLPIATAFTTQTTRLQAAGANYIVVFNLPNLGATPQVIATATAAAAAAAAAGASAAAAAATAAAVVGAASLATLSYNNALNGGLATMRDGIIPINVFGLVNEIFANPAAYGFTNITDRACGSGSGTNSVACGPAGSGLPFTYALGSNETFFFADGLHPTGAAHRMLANAVIATIHAPGQVSLAGEVPLQVYADHSGVINNQLFALQGAARAEGEAQGFANIQLGQQKYTATPNTAAADSNLVTLTVGADARYSAQTSLGVALSLGNGSSDNGAGGITSNKVLASIFGRMNFGSAYLSTIASAGSNALNIERAIPLGPSSRTESGDTTASHLALELGAGYLFQLDKLTHGPFIGVTRQKITVAAYREDTLSSTAMRFEEFTRDSLVGRVGYQVKGSTSAGTLHPYARVSYEQESEDAATRVQAGSNTMNGQFTLSGYAPAADWVKAELGLSMEISPQARAFVSYSGHLNDDRQDRNSVNLGVVMRF